MHRWEHQVAGYSKVGEVSLISLRYSLMTFLTLKWAEADAM